MATETISPLSEKEIINIAKITYIEEQKVAIIYNKLGKRFKNAEITEKLQEITKTEETHSKFWKNL